MFNHLRSVWCWFFGHKVSGRSVPKSFRTVSGELISGWKYYCQRCPTTAEFPDKRNLYQRTIPVWITRYRNKKLSRQFRDKWSDPKTQEAYRRYLDEQLRKPNY